MVSEVNGIISQQHCKWDNRPTMVLNSNYETKM